MGSLGETRGGSSDSRWGVRAMPRQVQIGRRQRSNCFPEQIGSAAQGSEFLHRAAKDARSYLGRHWAAHELLLPARGTRLHVHDNNGGGKGARQSHTLSRGGRLRHRSATHMAKSVPGEHATVAVAADLSAHSPLPGLHGRAARIQPPAAGAKHVRPRNVFAAIRTSDTRFDGRSRAVPIVCSRRS